MKDKISNLWKLIGNTPMLQVRYEYKGAVRRVFVKDEHYNMTGSIKDRMALYILEKAYENGKLSVNDLIVEATSGNTGIALAAIGRALGHRVRIIMPDWMSMERRALIEQYGAEVELISKEAGGFKGSIAKAESMGHYDGVFLPRQFANVYNVEAHEKTTGKEIWRQLASKGMMPDAFIAGVGTGGTIMGVGRYLKMLNPKIKLHPLEPLESPTFSTGHKVGSHRIQGISDEFIPEIVKLRELDEVVQISDGDAILMCQALGNFALGVGISSGANLLGAIKIQEKTGGNVVTVFPDSNKKYVSTDLFKQEPVREHYLTPKIKIIGVDVL